MRRAIGAAFGLLALDLILIVSSGGFSVLGPVTPAGVGLRVAASLLLLALRYRLGGRVSPQWYGYLAILLLCLPLVHFRAYRLRGDGMWYYAYTRSLVFDRDLDLGNEYRGLGVAQFRGSQPVRETGLPRNTFPIGAGLLWIPFVLLGHVGVWLRNLHGVVTAYDGFTDPYLHATALGGLLMGWLGLLVLDRLLRRWFSPGVAFAASIGTVMGGFLFWYMGYQPIYTQAPSFLLATVFIARWVRGPKTARDFAVLGLILGAASCVRWQNAILGFLPLWTLAGMGLERVWPAVRKAAALAAAFLLAFAPQLVAWKILFDRYYVGVPIGEDYMRWNHPFLQEVLFSSRHGLFSWSPVLMLAAVGFLFFLRREPRFGIPLVFLLAGLTYVNASVSDWWAGGSFGARRFDSAIPIFALGLATAMQGTMGFIRRRPGAVLGLFLFALVALNVLFMEQYRSGRLPVDDTMSWETAAGGMLEDFFDGVGYPFSFPANWAFALRYDRPKTQYDLLVGKYLFHWHNNLGGVIDLGVSDPPFIGNGWSTVIDWESRPREVRVAVSEPAGIFVPTDQPETLRILVECAVPLRTEPRWIEVWLNGARLGGFLPGHGMKEYELLAPALWWRRINLLEFATGDESSTDPFLVVDRIRFERAPDSAGAFGRQ
ncbi:MAG TPA: hypothetical protein VGC53_16675 [Vicinamibacteria bacterium]